MSKHRLAVWLSIVLFMLSAGTASASPAIIDQPAPDSRGGYFCENRGVPHPVLFVVAALFSTPYEKAQRWYCNYDFGVGEISLALTTSKLTDGETSPDEILEMKRSLGSWGRVWQALGLIGEPAPPTQN